MNDTPHNPDTQSLAETSRQGSFFVRNLPWLVPGATLWLSLLVICSTYMNNALCFAGIAVIFAIALFYRSDRFSWTLAAWAFVFGTAGELLCCYANLWVYKNPSYYGLPIWLPMIWPILMIAFGRLAHALYGVMEAKLPREARLGLYWLLGVGAVGYAITTFVIMRKPTIAIVYGVFLALIVIFARRGFNWVFFWVAAVGGAFGEIVCIQYEVWYYTQPYFRDWGIPVSLPLAWGLSANVIWLISRGCVGKALRQKAQTGFA